MENQLILINESEKCFSCDGKVTKDDFYCCKCSDKISSKKFGDEKNDAIIKGNYRYSLTRVLDNENRRRAVFWMLNPSTEDANNDDLTLKRCMSFAKRENCGRLEVVNLFAYRATNPNELKDISKKVAIGEENQKYVTIALAAADIVIVAWGENGKVKERCKDPEIISLLNCHSQKIYCLGKTKDGHPRHPSRIKNDEPLINFRSGKLLTADNFINYDIY